ncbi:MAG: hypothetical protein LC121_00950 [Anaerolineae bacterium]|nr:hypothetical protein [Anaerolineae bacterium]
MRRSKLIWLSLICALLLSLNAAVAQSNIFEQLVFDTRADLERLADQVLSQGVRPTEWSFNTDLSSPTIVSDLCRQRDLANAIWADTRPPD